MAKSRQRYKTRYCRLLHHSLYDLGHRSHLNIPISKSPIRTFESLYHIALCYRQSVQPPLADDFGRNFSYLFFSNSFDTIDIFFEDTQLRHLFLCEIHAFCSFEPRGSIFCSFGALA